MARVQFSEGTKPEAEETRGPPRPASERPARTRRQAANSATVFKAQHFLVVVLFVWFFLLHAAGIYLFTKGFLLTRLVLDSKSDCAVLPIDVQNIKGQKEQGCWYPAQFEKAVVVIIDALRYDFTVPQDQGHIYHNALTVLHEIAISSPNHAFLLPFIADPPTATLQRLKGLTTGTLPTFMDLGSNFAGTSIEEDNLITQLHTANKTLVHLGDDTWHALFPGSFNPDLTRAYDSFNVWDLHTVDNGVIDHILPYLKSPSQWDVIIGHFLGVDHAGHRYGPDHPQMTAKLRQMDDVIRQMIDNLPDNTLLVIMGDHGMDAKGDHGGESDDEVEAALWMYSKKPAFGRYSSESVAPPANAKIRPIAQIDLVPTLALLLGLPIPFNNLGAPIAEAFIGRDGKRWDQLAAANLLTAAQIRRYQAEYAVARGTEDEAQLSLKQLWQEATERYDEVKASTNRKDHLKYEPVAVALSRYMSANLSLCKSLWASFDIPCMLMGVAILVAAVGISLTFARSGTPEIADVPAMLVGAAGGGLVGAILGRLVVALGVPIDRLDGTLFVASFSSVLGSLFLRWQQEDIQMPLPATIWGWLSIVVTVSQAGGFASNSYTIWEDEILLFFISTFGLLALTSSFRQQRIEDRLLGVYHAALFLLLTRVASLSRLCREEQMPYCRTTYYASATSSTAADWHLVIPYALAMLLPTIIRTYYENTGSYHGSAVFWLGFAFRLGLLGSAIYWSLNAADDGDWLDIGSSTLGSIKVVTAQVVLVTALVAGTTTFIWAPPPLQIDEVDTSGVADGRGAKKPVVHISGLNNLHGSRYGILPTALLLAVILVEKPMGGGAMGLMGWQIFSMLEIVSTNKLQDTAIPPVVLSLMGSFYFFKTGHQATLASIQWDSAFIALKSIRYPWSPMLVILNTYGAQILAAVAVPMIVLWRRPVKQAKMLDLVARAIATHVGYYAVINLATTMWAGHLRRHLMLFRIFSPRFMTGAAVLLVVELVSIFVALLGFRTNTLGVTEIFGWA